ncbi:hypothetical protein TNCV_3754321 [Trichonephila clavipes]|nr:hypothetical protein TNCV_3754321 [Trichonephila clavipes]
MIKKLEKTESRTIRQGRGRKPESEEVITDVAAGNCRRITRNHCWYTHHRQCGIFPVTCCVRPQKMSRKEWYDVVSEKSG